MLRRRGRSRAAAAAADRAAPHAAAPHAVAPSRLPAVAPRLGALGGVRGSSSRRALAAALLLLSAAVVTRAQPVDWADLLPTASGTTLLVGQHYSITAPLVVPPNTVLRIVGDAAACGGPCVIDGLVSGTPPPMTPLPFTATQHIIVGAGATVTIGPNLVLKHGMAFGLGGGFVLGEPGSAVTLDGVALDTAFSLGNGGCVAVPQGTLVVRGSTLSGCFSFLDGGAIWADMPLSVTNSSLAGNTALGFGGAITSLASVLLHSSSCADNTGIVVGGCIYSKGDATMIVDSVLSRNTCQGAGGAVWTSAPPTVVGSTFIENHGIAFGGALFYATAPFGNFTAVNSTFLSNFAAVRACAPLHACMLPRGQSVPTAPYTATQHARRTAVPSCCRAARPATSWRR
jgi:hypothetical protein